MKLILSLITALSLSGLAHAGSQDHERELILKKVNANPVIQAATRSAKRLASATSCESEFTEVRNSPNTTSLYFKIVINCLNPKTDAMGQVQVDGSFTEELELAPELDIRIRFAG